MKNLFHNNLIFATMTYLRKQICRKTSFAKSWIPSAKWSISSARPVQRLKETKRAMNLKSKKKKKKKKEKKKTFWVLQFNNTSKNQPRRSSKKRDPRRIPPLAKNKPILRIVSQRSVCFLKKYSRKGGPFNRRDHYQIKNTRRFV